MENRASGQVDEGSIVLLTCTHNRGDFARTKTRSSIEEREQWGEKTKREKGNGGVKTGGSGSSRSCWVLYLIHTVHLECCLQCCL